MIVNPETLRRARTRWEHRHPAAFLNFDRTAAFLDHAATLNDITHPAKGLPFGALHHHLPADVYDVIDEADIMLSFRIARVGEHLFGVEIIDRDRLSRAIRAHLVRRGSKVRRSQLDAETAVANSATVVAVAAGAAGVLAAIRNIIGIVKDSLDIGRHLRERKKQKEDEDPT